MYVKCMFNPNPTGNFSGDVKITRPVVFISTLMFFPAYEMLGYAVISALGRYSSGIILSTPITYGASAGTSFDNVPAHFMYTACPLL